MIIVERAGPSALLQDLGRPGYAHLGVSPSGAADRGALALANRLVGNPEGGVAVECLLGGLEVTARDLHWVAVTGAPAEVRVGDRLVGMNAPVPLRPGRRLRIGRPAAGLRCYLAVRGGIETPGILGSCSTDTLSGLGPSPLRDGEELAIGVPTRELPAVDLAPVAQTPPELALLPGPRRDWFSDAAWTTLLGTGWQVTAEADRVAIRLGGPRLERRLDDELPSEAIVRGAVQVPSSGQPLIFGPDHPVTGGYPVIAVLTRRAGDRAAQLRPGQTVRFTPARR